MYFPHLGDMVENHDVVQVGYRGVDGSVVLDCPEISEAVRTAQALLGDKSLASYTAAGASCANRLQAEGVDLAGYTITETIEDNEAARIALGYERINLLGGSYGTRIEMIYAVDVPGQPASRGDACRQPARSLCVGCGGH